MEENVGAVDVVLTPADLKRIDEVAPKGIAFGAGHLSMDDVDL
ncbi:aldo/keto reductase [Paenibacillus polymyxa]|nr:aldo/keto reductase [Paenibacillus polymyxa]